MSKETERKFKLSLSDVPEEIILSAPKSWVTQGFLHYSRIRGLKIQKKRNCYSLQVKIHCLNRLDFEKSFSITKKKAEELERSGIFRNNGRGVNTLFAIRVRMIGTNGFLTFKDRKEEGSGYEFEYPLSYSEGNNLLKSAMNDLVIKERYIHEFAGHTFEIDVFHGVNEGLVIAEVELEKIDEDLQLPDFIKLDQEVTADMRYQNENLSKNPYKNWK